MDEIARMRRQISAYADKEAESNEEFIAFLAGNGRLKPVTGTSPSVVINDESGFLRDSEIRVLLHPFKRQKDGASPVHRHTYFEMGFVFRGEGASISDGEETHLTEGDLFIVSLQAVHQMKTFSMDDHVFNIMIRRTLFDDQFLRMISAYNLFCQFFMNSILNIPSDSCLIFRSTEQGDFTYYIYKILCESLFEQGRDQNYLRLLLACLFRELSRQYQRSMEEKSQKENEGLSISEVLQYLTDHYSEATLQSTADRFHYTTRFMTSFISKYTGSSFSQILKELKLQNASHLALYTGLPFDEIARTVGYNERGYLDRLFKQRFGKTMSEYRKEHAKSPRAAP